MATKPTWRVALALDELLDEIDRRSQGRSTASDGSIGNKAHQALGNASDHNPWVKDAGLGVVTARDFTHDPAHGFDAGAFADWLRKRCAAGLEKRVKYVISNRRIASAINHWAWRPYNGVNAHEMHVHVSVLPTKKLYDSRVSWKWGTTVSDPKPAPTGLATWPAWKLTKTDAAAYGDPKLAGTEIGWSQLLRYPPGVARLRREMTAGMGALTALIKATTAADAAEAASGHQLTAAELEQVARRGATLALDDLEARERDAGTDG